MKKLTFDHSKNTIEQVLGYETKEAMMKDIMADPDSKLSLAVGLATIYMNKETEDIAAATGMFVSVIDPEVNMTQPSRLIEYVMHNIHTSEQEDLLRAYIIEMTMRFDKERYDNSMEKAKEVMEKVKAAISQE